MSYLSKKMAIFCRMEELKKFGIVPLDVGVLETLFTSYKHPQKKITNLEQNGALIRLKR